MQQKWAPFAGELAREYSLYPDRIQGAKEPELRGCARTASSRRCLQYLLREKVGVKKGANQIQQLLDSKELPGYLAEDLDAIRNIGNFAAHPSKDTNTGEIAAFEPGEPEWLLNLLEHLFDFYFVQPARAQAKRDALNAKLQALGKPPMKKPGA